ncbi:ty3-gypsy retrotransposon protein [Cucumis melo var. makuwa]|uniref:Ty3-gypsy retrotransposon protein n=1 Tax=Cucumis melo var. makuwa TaxID=1194695 RepID=A0A5A7VGN3_CUCMM|nr:ty3-gypsy retrotransposon protein [Cucumis melo var. makuwa]TYK22424.1 ty3-gypsy retrotransposon protein [Cucumis melo var. makuwa]
MITNFIRAQYGGSSQTSFMYSKLYTKRIDNLRMLLGYQPPKFQQIYGKGNSKQHIGNFVETYIEKHREGIYGRKHDLAEVLQKEGKKQPIQLLECKRPEQAGKVDDPNYCKYHRVIGHQVEKCFVLKELILRLARKKKIVLDLEEEVAPDDPQGEERSDEEDDEGRGNKAQKNKKKKKTRKPKLVHKEDMDFARPQCLVTLADFFPIFRMKTQKSLCVMLSTQWRKKHPSKITREEGVSKQLSRFNVDDLLSLSQETKTILINALLNLEASSLSAPTATYKSAPYCMSIHFSNEDFLLGSKLHNRPLYVSGCVREQRVDQILINNGSDANIMSKSTMRTSNWRPLQEEGGLPMQRCIGRCQIYVKSDYVDAKMDVDKSIMRDLCIIKGTSDA